MALASHLMWSSLSTAARLGTLFTFNAVPAEGVEVAGFTRGLTAQEDVKRWYATATPQQLRARPPLLQGRKVGIDGQREDRKSVV